MKKAEHAVILIRRKRAAHGHHGGAWKVAYADFVTAMMAFFLVMWLASQDSRIRTAVAGYFQEPGLLPHQTSNSLLGGGRGGVDGSGMPALERQPSGVGEGEQRALAAAAENIRKQLSGVAGMGSLRDQVQLAVTAEGLRVELIEKSGSSFFGSGSADLLGESRQILHVIAEEIGKLNNDVVIEGHTDSRPYAVGDSYGNWELSTDRGNAARRVMEAQGLRSGQVRAVRGLADTDLRYREQPLDPRNRRVSIVVRSQLARQLEQAAVGTAVAVQ
jgi:chemotaxis protein MotB